MHTKSIYLLILLLLNITILFFSQGCNLNSGSSETDLELTLENPHGSYQGYVYLFRITDDGMSLIDSVLISDKEDKKIVFQPVQSMDLYSLRLFSGESISLALSSSDQPKVSFNEPPYQQTYQVSGSSESQYIKNIYQMIDVHLARYDSIYMLFHNDRDRAFAPAHYDSLMLHTYQQVYLQLQDSIRNHPKSLASIFALYTKFGRKYILVMELDFPFFKEIADHLNEAYPQNTHVLWLNKKVDEMVEKQNKIQLSEKRLQSGNIFPNFQLPSLDQKAYTLNESKAQYKIIYLWKGTEAGFYQTNPILKRLYQQYPRKKLDIISISFDQDKLHWANYSRLENLPWINLIVLPELSPTLNPKNELPRLFLLDAENRILKSDIPKDSLEIIVKQYIE